jgi:hypothetical protein
MYRNSPQLQIIGKRTQRLPTKLKIAKWVGYFALFDILFLPYFQLIVVPFSLPVILFFMVWLRIEIKLDHFFLLFSIIVFFSLISIIYSFHLSSPQYFITLNIKRVAQLLLIFSYFFYFKWLASKIKLHLTPFIVLFIIYFSFLSLTFIQEPLVTTTFLKYIYGKVTATHEHALTHLRYSYFFSDPNTAGYFFLIAISPLLTEKRSVLSYIFLNVGIFLLIVTFQSRGVLISFIIMYIFSIFITKELLLFKITPKLIMIILIPIILVPSLVYSYNVMQLDLNAINRLFGVDYGQAGASRTGLWMDLINNIYPLPFGRGYAFTYQEYKSFPEHVYTHSDFFRLLYSYGFITLSAMILFLFSKIKTLPNLIIPALMAFTANSLIDSQKLFALFLSLLAIMLANNPSLYRKVK